MKPRIEPSHRPYPLGHANRGSQSGPHPLRLLYIGGWGRSGSTLLDLMLGEVPEFFSAGEIRQIWEKGGVENRHCGCKVRFYDCPFWTQVGDEAFGGWQTVDFDAMVRLRHSLDRPSAIPRLIASRWRRARDDELDRYVDALAAVLRGIRAVSGAEVIVDSSKSPAHALLLASIPAVDVRLVHLVRDSRGVAYSWLRGNLQVLGAGRRVPRRKFGAAAASWRWLLHNAITPSVTLARVPYLFLRYEDMVRTPRSCLERVVHHAYATRASRPDDLPKFAHHKLTLRTNHNVYGNALRFTEGDLTIRIDEEWRAKMDHADRRVVTALTFPLLLRYGYSLASAGVAGRTKPNPLTRDPGKEP